MASCSISVTADHVLNTEQVISRW